jgi:hypothetical protein
MEQNTNRQANNIGVAALVTGIITFVMAVIPCIGALAIIPGIVTIVLALIGLNRAYEQGRGMVIAGLIIGIVASMISLSQWAFLGKAVQNKNLWPNEIRKAIEEVKTEISNEFDEGNFSIKIQSGDEVVEIKSSVDMKNLEEKLEQLEESRNPDTTRVKKQ